MSIDYTDLTQPKRLAGWSIDWLSFSIETLILAHRGVGYDLSMDGPPTRESLFFIRQLQAAKDIQALSEGGRCHEAYADL